MYVYVCTYKQIQVRIAYVFIHMFGEMLFLAPLPPSPSANYPSIPPPPPFSSTIAAAVALSPPSHPFLNPSPPSVCTSNPLYPLQPYR